MQIANFNNFKIQNKNKETVFRKENKIYFNKLLQEININV